MEPNRVRRLMREAGIYSVMSRRFNKPRQLLIIVNVPT
ncbi:Transposase subunit B [Leuconostoc citreum]|nr:Transposase subunit B [Leuconostoc citreum]